MVITTKAEATAAGVVATAAVAAVAEAMHHQKILCLKDEQMKHGVHKTLCNRR